MAGSSIHGRDVPRPVRAVVAVGLLLVVVLLVGSAIASYRSAVTHSGGSQETTATPSAPETGSVEAATDTAKAPEGGEAEQAVSVLVLIDGLNLREKPSTGARVIKRLSAGQRLLFVEEGDGWYHVRDVDGADGWVAAGGSYTRLEK